MREVECILDTGRSSNAEPALDWDGYCVLPAETQLIWERRDDALTQGMIFIMNSKNEIAKKDLRLAYSQGNYTTYPTNIETAARYLTTQYPSIKSGNQRKKTNKRKRMIHNLKIRTMQRLVLPGYTLKTLQQMKKTPLLAEIPT